MPQENQPQKLLLVDTIAQERDRLTAFFEQQGFRVNQAADGSQARKILRRGLQDVLVVDLSLPDADGLGLIKLFRRKNPEAIVVVLADKGAENEGLKALRAGADDLFQRPINPANLKECLRKAEERRAFLKEVNLVGHAPPMRRIYETIEQIGPTDITVMIQGESGTGKELVARAIHMKSERRNGPFLAINCGALAEGVLDSELFGHEKGAFTGAVSRRAGRFELADGGTLFLDEVTELPPATQVKLLRVLEEKEFMRVGGTAPLKVDVRLIAASNSDLEEAVNQGQFREDLFYRLNVVAMRLPPLRERQEDIPLLVNSFIEHSQHDRRVRFKGISPEAMELLKRYNWPGNVRELKNLVDSLIVLSPDSEIQPQDVPKYLRPRTPSSDNLPMRVEKTREQAEREIIYKTLLGLRADVAELKEILAGEVQPVSTMEVDSQHVDWVEEGEEAPPGSTGETVQFPVGTDMSRVERDMIRKTLDHVGGNRKKAAELLGIGERTLYRKIQEYELNG
ncbi:sigma-54-dependent transcriptional regulator [Candidatus Zixiibacteriota bacterium]